MPGCGKWQSKESSSQSMDICPICKFAYAKCQTCLKYGQQSHTLDREKTLNAHDNGGFVKDEKETKKTKK